MARTQHPQAQSIVSPILTCVFSNAQIEVEIRTLTDRRGVGVSCMVGKHIACACRPYTQLQPLGLDSTKQVWEIKGVKTGYNKTCLVPRNLEICTVFFLVKTL